MTKKKLKDLKPEDIVSTEPVAGSSRNASAWNLPDFIDIRNRKNEEHYLYKNNVVLGRWRREIHVDHKLVRTEFVEDCHDLLEKDYSRVIGLADCGEYIADYTPARRTTSCHCETR